MANLFRLSVILLCCLFEAICVETDDSKFRDAAQFVLDTFNRRPDSSYVYDSAKISNVYEKVRNVFVLKTVKSKFRCVVILRKVSKCSFTVF